MTSTRDGAMEAGMALMLKVKFLLGAWWNLLAAICVLSLAGVLSAQVTLRSGRSSTYRGAATVSIATLKVPQGAWKHFEKARSLALKHRPEESKEESDKALTIAPNFAAARILQASQQLALRDFTGAITSANEARKSEPDAQYSGLILAGAYNSLHRYGEAMDMLLGLNRVDAESWQAKYERARAATGLGDVDQALKSSSEAYEAAPHEFADALLMRANALMLAKRWMEASDKLYAYQAMPGVQIHREQVRDALLAIAVRMKAEHMPGVALASR